MRKIVLVLPVLALTLAACTPEQQNAAIGATAGALVGSAVSSESDRTKGAILGAAVGVAGAAVVNEANRSQQMCNYRDSYGRVYQAPC
jgi:surface antigen